MGALSLALAQAGIGILALTPELATLEDLFFRLTEGGDADRSRRRAATTPVRRPLARRVRAAVSAALEETG